MNKYIKILNIFSNLNFDWLIYLSLFVVLFVQIRGIFQAKSLTKLRFRVRLGLNLLLWLFILLFVIQPQWHFSSNTNRVLLISDDIPLATIQKVKDSLKITENFSVKDFSQLISDDPSFIEHLGNIYLLGEGFNTEILSKIFQKNIVWLPFFKQDELQAIEWKGIVRKSEMQEIAGKIELSEPKMLKINYGNQILDSLKLQKGLNNFKLRFPIFSIGRTETELFLEEKSLQKINFFARKTLPINVQFILENPDFESKSLAEWLGKNGNHVEISTTVAKNTESQTSINKSKQKFIADIVITDARNASNAVVKKAIADTKSVLFLGISNPETELKTINQALGTQYFAKRISNEEFTKLSEDLTALPYQFAEKWNQNIIADYPIAIQHTAGKIGVSFLNETFPLKLSGDSLTYNKIWTSVFQQLNPTSVDNFEVNSPIFLDTKTNINLNNRSVLSNDLKISGDTIAVQSSAINSLSSNTDFIFRKINWQPLHDSLEVFVEENTTNLSKSKQIEGFLQTNSISNSLNQSNILQSLTSKLPDWAWFLLILLSFTAVWIEPKLRF